jgi:hypothetical protein
VGERNDGGLAPAVIGDFPANVFAHLLVEVNQLGVDGLKRALPGALNEREHFTKGLGGFGDHRHGLVHAFNAPSVNLGFEPIVTCCHTVPVAHAGKIRTGKIAGVPPPPQKNAVRQ